MWIVIWFVNGAKKSERYASSADAERRKKQLEREGHVVTLHKEGY